MPYGFITTMLWTFEIKKKGRPRWTPQVLMDEALVFVMFRDP